MTIRRSAPLLPTPDFPCLPDRDNRYAGCVGVARCKAGAGDTPAPPRCLFGRWAVELYRWRETEPLKRMARHGG